MNVGDIREKARSRGRSSPGFVSLRNAQMIEPTTALAAVSPLCMYLVRVFALEGIGARPMGGQW